RQIQVLAEVCVPSMVADERFVLHPGLMDSALQAMVGFMNDTDTTAMPLAVPFALESLEIFGPCAPTMWALIRPSASGSGSLSQESDTLRKMDIDLCDATGTVAVRLQGLAGRFLEREQHNADGPGALSPWETAWGEGLRPKAGHTDDPLSTPTQSRQGPSGSGSKAPPPNPLPPGDGTARSSQPTRPPLGPRVGTRIACPH